MDEVKRNQFVARLSRALGRDQVPTYVPAFDYSHGPQENMFKDLSREQIVTMFKEQGERGGKKFGDTTPDKLGETIMAVIEERGNGLQNVNSLQFQLSPLYQQNHIAF